MSVGDDLRQARLAAGLSLDDVAAVTRIRPVVLEAMEEDDFTLCGGSAYARGQIRSVAIAVGIDPDDVIDRFDGDRREAQMRIPSAMADPDDLDRKLAIRRIIGWVAAIVAVILILVVVVSVL